MEQKARFRKCVSLARQKGKGKQEIVYLPESERPGEDIVGAIFLFNGTALG